MRKEFLTKLTELAEKDPKIILVIGDVGFRYIEDFKAKFPNQFLNTGACEQSMMGVAVGLWRAGWKPYVYTMRNFIAFRPYEQVRNDIAYGNANVKLFGVAGSEAYKFLGYSHNVGVCEIDGEQGIRRDEDILMMEWLPNMKVYQTKHEERFLKEMQEEYERSGPAYFII